MASIQVLNPRLPQSGLRRLLADRFCWVWLFAIAIVSFIIASTLEYAPFLFVDELMNVDLGRVILNPETDWSIAWMTETGTPVFLLSYIGPVLQEVSYKLLGELGPRYSALLGALAAATVMVGWLRVRGVTKVIAFALGLAFLLDPLFVQAYTTGRVDGWAMALCLLSCFLLRYATINLKSGSTSTWFVLISGAIAAVAAFTWISALLLFPLILSELIILLKKSITLFGIRKGIAVPTLSFTLGCLATCILLLVPIAPRLFALFENIVKAISINLNQGDNTNQQHYFMYFFSQSIELLRILKFTPFVFITALIAAISLREISHVLGLALICFILLHTVVYTSRVQYLLPYFIVLTSGFLQQDSQFFKRWTVLKLGILSLIILWAVSLTLVARTSVAFTAREERDRNLVNHAALAMVGTGSHKVYVPYELYYAGRSAGWNMYRAYLSFNATLSLEVLLKILPHVDYAIIEQPSKELEVVLMRDGWRDKGSISLYESPAEPFNGVTTNDMRIRNLYHINRKPYGPYRLFVRENKSL
ncbi:hypothetical protein [Pontibacter mucosus]|nr:hypothetical protein [Pontibacter mucosus]